MHSWSARVGGTLLTGALLLGLAGCEESEPEGVIEPVEATEAEPGVAAGAAAEAAPGEPEAAPAVEIVELDVKGVADLIEGGQVAIFDANGQSTREEHGVVPGAVLLDSTRDYDLSLLPEDESTQLVFYCANTRCSASDTAAERAAEAGYRQVAVMPPGIEGWKEAGKPTERPKG